MRRLALVAAALALVAGALVGQATGAERFKRHTVRGQGVSLAVPASWIAVDANLPDSAIAKLGRENPKLAPFLAQLTGPSSAAKFLALDRAAAGGFATNVNVVVVPAPSLAFDRYRQLLVAEIRGIVGSARIDNRAVTIGGKQALRLSYPFKLTVGGRSLTVQTLQYAFLRPGRSVVVTYTTLPGLKARYAKTFARSAASIRVT